MNGASELLVSAMRNLVKSAIASGNRFSWGVIKPHLKSLKNHSRVEKITKLA